MIPFREALAAGKPQLGFCSMYPASGILERIGGDWDWLWVDGQHGQFGYADMLAMVRACDLVKRPAFVRVPGHDFGSIGLSLDMGAAGVIVPVIDTVEEAKQAVKAAKFPPLGGRSYGGRRPIDLHGRLYSDTANDDTMLICQIESPEAITNAGRIAATPGVDALFLGPDDLMLRRGIGMNVPRSKEMLGKDMEAVIKACRDNGKFAVTVAVGAELIKFAVSVGFNMIVCGGDVSFLANTSKTVSADARAAVQGVTPATPATQGKSNSPYG